ncbi:hypothetical protein D0T49_01240 [Paludibacter sp. 221]|nr:hypothetical protein [Paludibacter sp. 221]
MSKITFNTPILLDIFKNIDKPKSEVTEHYYLKIKKLTKTQLYNKTSMKFIQSSNERHKTTNTQKYKMKIEKNKEQNNLLKQMLKQNTET